MSKSKNNKNKNKSRYKKRNTRNKRSSFKRGLKIGCINTQGLVAYPTKRIDINNWMHLHDLDVVCLQEWYVPNQKDIDPNDNENRRNDNINDNIDDNEGNDDYKNGNFGLHALSVTLDMSLITGYKKMEHDNKTIILYKTDLQITTFDHFKRISQNGLDISWLAIITHRKIIVIGSCYHSPNHNCTYEQIVYQKNRIKKELKKYKKKIIFNINGDFNSKHTIWGSTITDRRGEYLLDWMGENGMSFLNNGDYTHTRSNGGKDVLDVMLMDIKEQDVVTDWSCHSVFSTRKMKTPQGTITIPFSDHRGMICTLNLDPMFNERPDKICWNLDESKKVKFQEAIKVKMISWNEMNNSKMTRRILIV